MQEIIEKMIKNFSEFYKGLDTTKKMALVSIAGFIAVGVIVVVIWASKSRFVPIYTDLNNEDATNVMRMLEEMDVTYQKSKDGKTILVPDDEMEIVRLEIAKSGMNFTGSVGYEVFDKQSFGTTSFVQKVNKQRALEGELIRTIKYISSVKRARVHLSLPENSPFVTEKKAPGASVVVELKRGSVLTEQEIKGIASLVSSAVDGMRPEHVVILDHKGKKLSENIGDPMTAYTANRIALESKLNRKLEGQVEDILAKVAGEGKVIAKVNVTMDFTESISTKTSYDNENTAVLSEVKNTQKLNGSRPSPQGIPGARSNLPSETPQPGIPETRNNVDKELSTRNFNVPSTVTKSKKPTAGIKKISVAVMIDGKRVPMVNDKGEPVLGENGKQKIAYEPWSQKQLEDFKAVVTSTLGIDRKRGDTIVVKNMEFAHEDLSQIEEIIKERENRELIKNLVKYLSIGLVITLFFFLVVRPFIQWVTDNTVESVEDFLPKTLEELEKVQANQKLPGLEDALPQIEEKLNPEKIEGNMLREKIISLIENNPGKAAQIMHELIHVSESDKQIA